MVEDHCSIAEALLADVHETLQSDRPPPKAIVAQNTGKRYGPPKAINKSIDIVTNMFIIYENHYSNHLTIVTIIFLLIFSTIFHPSFANFSRPSSRWSSRSSRSWASARRCSGRRRTGVKFTKILWVYYIYKEYNGINMDYSMGIIMYYYNGIMTLVKV